ncbi:Uncharacterised protein [uncultured archaeon]|nr:Uncharacterised protein [uncultured archaeon]
MTIKENTLPHSTMDLASASGEGVRLLACASGMELLFFTALPRVKMHGLKFSASENPSVILGGRKQPVMGVF